MSKKAKKQKQEEFPQIKLEAGKRYLVSNADDLHTLYEIQVIETAVGGRYYMHDDIWDFADGIVVRAELPVKPKEQA